MKQFLPFFSLVIFTVVLCGCPYDSPYNLDDAPLQNIDESLLGDWTALVSKPSDENHPKEEPVKISFQKRTEMEYNISITGSIDELKPWQVISNDSITGTACLSAIAGKQFLNTFIHGRVYIAEVKKEKGALSILPLAENFTSKFIKSSKELRTAVEFHYKVRLTPGYDPLFSLKNLQRVN